MFFCNQDNLEIMPVKPSKTKGSRRGEIMTELLTLHNGDKLWIKKANWKRYILWLKSKQLKDSPENQVKFKKSKMFIKPLEIREICVLLSHIKEDLPYVLSVAKDKSNRKEPVAGYIRSLFPKKA